MSLYPLIFGHAQFEAYFHMIHNALSIFKDPSSLLLFLIISLKHNLLKCIVDVAVLLLHLYTSLPVIHNVGACN
jgi:hypothetical protein